MSYNYSTERQTLFTEQGQVQFLKVRDQVKYLLKQAGAFRLDKISQVASSWTTVACVDRLVELGEIVELARPCWQQYRVFTSPEVDNR